MEKRIQKANESLKQNLPNRVNRHVMACILRWGNGSDTYTEQKQRQKFKEFLQTTFNIEAKELVVDILSLHNTINGLINENQQCTVLILYYFGTGSAAPNDLVWKPTANMKGELHKTAARRKPPRDTPAINPPRELKWSDLKIILGQLNRKTLLITDCDYGNETDVAALFSSAPRPDLDTLQILTTIAGQESNLYGTLTETLRYQDRPKVAIKAAFNNRHVRHVHVDLSREQVGDGVVLYYPLRTSLRCVTIPFPGDKGAICSYICDHWWKDAPDEVAKVHISPVPGRPNKPEDLQITIHVFASKTEDSPQYVWWIHQLHLNTGLIFGRSVWNPSDDAFQYSETVVQAWNDNRERSWTILPGPHDGRYDRVHVLPLRFEHTGFSLDKKILLIEEMKNLAGILTQNFGYTVLSTFEIPRLEGQALLEKKLRSTVDDLGPRDLLIVVYSGHGANPTNYDDNATWEGDNNSGFVNWSSLQGILYGSECDTAQIIDACFSGSAIPMKGAPQGRNEILAASSRKLEAYINPGSYLNMICAALLELAGQNQDQPPFSLNKLHNLLLRMTYTYNKDNPNQKHPDREHWLHEDSPSSIILRPRMAPPADSSSSVYARVYVDNSGRRRPGKIVFETARVVFDTFKAALSEQ